MAPNEVNGKLDEANARLEQNKLVPGRMQKSLQLKCKELCQALQEKSNLAK